MENGAKPFGEGFLLTTGLFNHFPHKIELQLGHFIPFVLKTGIFQPFITLQFTLTKLVENGANIMGKCNFSQQTHSITFFFSDLVTFSSFHLIPFILKINIFFNQC